VSLRHTAAAHGAGQINFNETPNSLAAVDRIFHAFIAQAKALLDDLPSKLTH
jgi:hypothetical protein